jgi:hypothetical protein
MSQAIVSQTIDRLKRSHHIALTAWRECIPDQGLYAQLCSVEANLQRAGVYVVYDEDGDVTYEGVES